MLSRPKLQEALQFSPLGVSLGDVLCEVGKAAALDGDHGLALSVVLKCCNSNESVHTDSDTDAITSASTSTIASANSSNFGMDRHLPPGRLQLAQWPKIDAEGLSYTFPQ